MFKYKTVPYSIFILFKGIETVYVFKMTLFSIRMEFSYIILLYDIKNKIQYNDGKVYI